MGIIQEVDRELIQAATGAGGVSAARDQAVYAVAELLPIVALLIGLWIFFRGGKTKIQRERNQNVILIALAAVLVGIGVYWLVGETIDRERPFVTLLDLHFLDIVSPTSNSFPSLHALLLFAFAGTILYIGHHPNLSKVLLLIAVVVAIARVFAGVHYPTDVLAGAVLGLLVAKLLSWQSSWLEDQMK